MFGQYFGNHYFGDTYFGPAEVVVPPEPPEAIRFGDALPAIAYGAILVVVVSLVPGKATGAANVEGATLPIVVSVSDAGEAIGEFGMAPFALSIHATIKGGLATGEQNLSDEEMMTLLELA